MYICVCICIYVCICTYMYMIYNAVMWQHLPCFPACFTLFYWSHFHLSLIQKRCIFFGKQWRFELKETKYFLWVWSRNVKQVFVTQADFKCVWRINMWNFPPRLVYSKCLRLSSVSGPASTSKTFKLFKTRLSGRILWLLPLLYYFAAQSARTAQKPQRWGTGHQSGRNQVLLRDPVRQIEFMIQLDNIVLSWPAEKK